MIAAEGHFTEQKSQSLPIAPLLRVDQKLTTQNVLVREFSEVFCLIESLVFTVDPPSFSSLKIIIIKAG